ncbi:iron-sulfur cluster carrier protein ApbC [Thiosulfativibrio zosterae]|uniref:Iron-sulfur cluster carrier protein n=1 Tax=Thiosulfativibrio zosterae TaxID=2675053 RepID=A0A6F8PMS0_9GAMM|nr:iron-sulfur cluster carrier protein ApbC [Thiosulfativibrio zosterae]BBP43386.1 iron-sulfur cluster carrier protein [Thiosulfativibrio zosterae]
MSFLKKLFGNGISEDLQHQIETQLALIVDQNLQQDLMAAKALESLSLKKGILDIHLKMPYPAKSLWPHYEQQITHLLTQIDEIDSITFTWKTEITTRQTQGGTTPFSNIKNIIAVASGKGGVGKSTTSVNLALALQQEGARVGILDADIYGPSIPTMLNIKEKPQTQDGKSMLPLQAYGLQAMSIGALMDSDTPMVWRGPLVTQTLIQLLKETDWQDLDYLIIDLPPGTGDVQLTLAQQIPVTGAVIVTTPQEVSLIDARKGLKMFEKVNIPILGIIENMSTHICSNCGFEEAIFGEHGGQKMAEAYQVNFLGAMPLNGKIRQQADEGKPTVVAEPTSEITLKYKNIAYQVSAEIAKQRRNYSNAFPNIVIQNT